MLQPLRVRVSIAVSALVLAACSSGATKPEVAVATPGELSNAKELIAYDWTVGPGVETYYCVYQTLTEDVWISAFSPTEPPGTHHVVLGFNDPAPETPDGVISSDDAATGPRCSGVQLSQNMMYFGGKGAGSLTMPSGVALKIPAGKQLFLGLHLFNTDVSPLTGRSGMKIVSPEPGTVSHEAEAIAVGKVAGLLVPPGESKQTGLCTMTDDVTAFALAPHMHLTGTHNNTTEGPPAGQITTNFDQDYTFNEQPYVPLDPPIFLHKNDVVNVECDYANTGSSALTFGESTKNEMCFTFVYRYPKIATTPVCVN
jgi:hypothetical protein